MKQYALAEVFASVQGEGANTGMRSVFVRFAGCNTWSGHEGDRQRDAERTGSKCPLWCDTNFLPREHLTAEELRARVVRLMPRPDLIVFTGGEPLLQLDRDVCSSLANTRAPFALETNGTIRVPGWFSGWVCVSPKVDERRLVQRFGNELKVVFPAYDPAAYSTIAHQFEQRFVQPEFSQLQENTTRALAWVLENPGWRLSTQMHKTIGVP